jgi:RNA polymerase sigma-70 factor (ECF subfamily)
MNSEDSLSEQFENNRTHLRAVAYRILGNVADVDDVMQETWIRLSNATTDDINNLAGWLTTVVSRLCLNTLRTRQRHSAESLFATPLSADLADLSAVTPEEQAILADSMGRALLVVLEMLSPAERISFVLHDVFSVSFDEIAEILGKSTDACRQLASRARRRVRSADDPSADPQRQRDVVVAFLAASKSGDFESLLDLLSPDAELVADAAAIAIGAPVRKDGAVEVATRFSGGAQAARVALLDGMAGIVWAHGGKPKVAFDFTVIDGVVVKIEMIADEDVLNDMQIEYPRRERGHQLNNPLVT